MWTFLKVSRNVNKITASVGEKKRWATVLGTVCPAAVMACTSE
jgi:hypothetical protein